MTVKRSSRTLQDPKRAIELFYHLLKDYPYLFGSERKNNYQNSFTTIFWVGYFDELLQRSGYIYLLDLKPEIVYPGINKNTNNTYNNGVTNSFFQALNLIELKEKKGIMIKNRYFQFIEKILTILINPLKFIDQSGGWENVIKNKQSDLQRLFGFYIESEEFYNIDSFCSKINEIFNIYFGNNFLELFSDGTLEYIEYTEELQLQYPVVKSLVSKKMDNVIELINKIREDLNNKEYYDGMWHCRDVIEAFIKDFLIQKNITSGTDNRGNTINVNDMTISELSLTLRQQINPILNIPSFANRSNIEDHLNHYILSMSSFFSTMTNNFSHGKGTNAPTTYTAEKKDVETVFNYSISFMNNLLYFS